MDFFDTYTSCVQKRKMGKKHSNIQTLFNWGILRKRFAIMCSYLFFFSSKIYFFSVLCLGNLELQCMKKLGYNKLKFKQFCCPRVYCVQLVFLGHKHGGRIFFWRDRKGRKRKIERMKEKINLFLWENFYKICKWTFFNKKFATNFIKILKNIFCMVGENKHQHDTFWVANVFWCNENFLSLKGKV